jgi:hypothetical protein
MTKERRERSETRASEGGDRNNVGCLSGNARPSPTIISAWRSLLAPLQSSTYRYFALTHLLTR